MSKIVEIDCSTGVSIERDMTEAELATQIAMRAQAEEARVVAEAEAEAKAAAKASAEAKLAALGLTAEEIAAL
jgi:hypothetical protein